MEALSPTSVLTSDHLLSLPNREDQDDTSHGQVSPGEGCEEDLPGENQSLVQFIIYFFEKDILEWQGDSLS